MTAGAQNATPQFSGSTPGPPFHMSNVNNVDMNAAATGVLAPQLSPNGGLSRTRSSTSQAYAPATFTFNDANEMDMSGDRSVDQPSPATLSSQSRGGSTSHSSYSPGQQTEHHLPYRASPKMPSAGATAFPGFSASTDVYTNTFNTSSNMSDDSFSTRLHGRQ